jgi:hypothetical protein
MNDANMDLDQIEEETLLEEVSDEALEATAAAAKLSDQWTYVVLGVWACC